MAAFLRAPLDAGSTPAWVVAAGEAAAAAEGAGVVVAFFRDFFAGEADASADGDSLAAGDAWAAAFLRECFAGEAEAVGLGD